MCGYSKPWIPYLTDQSQSGRTRSYRIVVAFGSAVGCILFCHHYCWIFFFGGDTDTTNKFSLMSMVSPFVLDQFDPEVCLGHLKRYSFKELRAATDHFNKRNILGIGGFGKVYKGDYYEAIVGDFGLAKLLDHRDSNVKKLHQDGKLHLMVDKDLKNNLDLVVLEEMVQVALLCTQFHPLHSPKMSEVMRMLEGDGLAEK
ncbi:hypothetical protein GIB67_003441 [Kingdonia uniflora]|uniref:Uncharacterized protein n=1 Tax=Kingdonia uniflora TaxID=39325 RepID=A0A7J7P9D8_9MAGN|nr:hypothetical protein GIB67_003441 [Kingdonia uniflora]